MAVSPYKIVRIVDETSIEAMQELLNREAANNWKFVQFAHLDVMCAIFERKSV